MSLESLYSLVTMISPHTDSIDLGLNSRVKGQSAIEYLMTYGWMLLVVAVVGGAIFSVVQSQSVESVSGFSGGDVVVDDFGVTSSGNLQLILRNSAGESIEVTGIEVSGNGNTAEWSDSQSIGVGNTESVTLNSVEEGSGANSLDVEVFYDVGGLENLGVSGSISGNFEVVSDSINYGLVGGEWSHVTPAGAEGGYDYFFNTSTTPYGKTYSGNSSVKYTDDGFFVMKYQASKNGSLPVSNGSVGWNSISFNNDSAQTGPSAYTACEDLNGYTDNYDVHLVTNREWMTIARQVAQRSDNWADGVVGSNSSTGGGLYQGNHDEGGSYDRAVDLGGYPNAKGAGGDEQRTHNLSSGDQVWDLSGDLWQWVDADENGTKMTGDSSSKLYERLAQNSTVSNGDGLGYDYGFDIDDTDAALRGGGWIYGDSAGVFFSSSNSPDYSYSRRGFRCSAVPVS